MQIKAEKLTKIYKNGYFSKLQNIAVKEADISIDYGETVGLLGDSGSGKSTIGQILAGLIKPSGGRLYFQNEEITYPFKGDLRRQIQILFQHPEVSFNPKISLIKSMEEPYKFYGMEFSKSILCKDIEKFGLYEEHLERLPSELSGGELQRAALARILTVKPSFIVLDEPTSMLDVISQAQMIQLLREVQESQGTSYLFITHDVKLCEIFSDRIYKINKGVLFKETFCNS